MNNSLVAVYGSLRKNHGNHIYLRESKYLGTERTEPNYSMVSLGGFPGVIENGKKSVVIEVYSVDENTLNNLNRLEGYEEGRDHNFYDRIIIETSHGPAYMYVLGEEYLEDHQLVETGDWAEFYKETVYG